MKKANEQLEEALASIQNGVLNLTDLEDVSLKEIFTFLQNPNISKNDITSINILGYRNWTGVKEFILQLDNNSSFKPQLIKTSRFLGREQEVLSLELKTNITIDNSYTLNHRKGVLLKKFLEEFRKNNFNVEEEQLSKFIETACKEAKTSDNIEMQYMQALEICSNFNFSEIDEKYSNLQPLFTNLYRTQKVKSEIYHYKQEDDLHFYMVKVNGANKDAWSKFLVEQDGFANSYKGNDPVIKNASMGMNGFRASIKYYNQDLTDIYVAFVSNKIWENKKSIDTSAVEMFITMMTSQNAHFISNMGITRSPIHKADFTTIKHSNLAVKLHSFIAACAKEIYHDKKEYMITVPVQEMTKIIIKEYEKKGILDKIYIGHQDTEISQDSLEDLKTERERERELNKMKLER